MIAGKNVIEKQLDNKFQYFAACTGIFAYRNNILEVLDLLKINGDVGSLSGNIHSEKDVFISGNITGGYTVECKGNVVIDGSVENAAIIKCDGSLVIRQGVFGEKTVIISQHIAEIGFIQDSNLHIEGDLHVRKFIYNSKVYCGGQLIVDGASVEATRGSVLGGRVVAMRCMELMSVGCEGEDTFLYCGINPEFEKLAFDTKNTIITYNKKVTALRSTIGINLDSEDAMKKLQLLSDHEKERVKKILLAIKTLAGEQKVLSEKLITLEKLVHFERPELCYIEIKKKIFPTLFIDVASKKKEITLPVTGLQRFEFNNI